MNKNLLLIIGLVLVVIGLTKPNISNIIKPKPIHNDTTIVEPSDNNLKKEAEDVIKVFSESSSASAKDAAELRDLYCGLARLIKIDGEDKIVSSTEHIRQANSIGGRLLKLDIKGKYPNLAKENQDVVLAAIGDDSVALTTDLRNKASDAFMALAWAYDQAAK